MKTFQSPLVVKTQKLSYTDDADTLQVCGIVIPNRRWVELEDYDGCSVNITEIDIVMCHNKPDFFTMFVKLNFPYLEYNIHGTKFKRSFIRHVNGADDRDESIMGIILNMATVVEIVSNKNNRHETKRLELVCKFRDHTSGYADLMTYLNPIAYITNPSKGIHKFVSNLDSDDDKLHITIDNMAAFYAHMQNDDVIFADGYDYKIRYIDPDRFGAPNGGFVLNQLFHEHQERISVSADPNHNDLSKAFHDNEGMFYVTNDTDNKDALDTFNRLLAKLK
jgi:hypothetical protein